MHMARAPQKNPDDSSDQKFEEDLDLEKSNLKTPTGQQYITPNANVLRGSKVISGHNFANNGTFNS